MKSRIYVLFLSVFVALSLILTYLIMFQPRRLAKQENLQPEMQNVERALEAVFTADMLVVSEDTPHTYQATTNEAVILNSLSSLKEAKDVQVIAKELLTKEAYNQIFLEKGTHIFFPVPYYIDKFRHLLNVDLFEDYNKSMNRIFIVQETNQIIIGNDETYQMIRFSYDGSISLHEKIQAIHSNHLSEFIKVTAIPGKETMVYLPLTHTEKMSRVYLLEKSNWLDYVKQLFGTTTNIRNQSNATDYTFVSTTNDQLTINRQTDRLVFEKQQKGEVNKNPDTLAFEAGKLDHWSQRLLYYGEIDKGAQIYRFVRYVHGLPLQETETRLSQTLIQVGETGVNYLQTSIATLQTELSTHRQTVVLEGIEQFLQQYNVQALDLTNVSRVFAGYTTTLSSDGRVVMLVPEWYAVVDKETIRLKDYLDKVYKEGELVEQ